MVNQQAALLRPETLIAEFKKIGVTHIVTIPDSETNYLYELMQEQDWLSVVPASREGETFAIALGLSVGGKVPVCLIQNTGMMESGDSIRGMALDAGFRRWPLCAGRAGELSVLCPDERGPGQGGGGRAFGHGRADTRWRVEPAGPAGRPHRRSG